MGKKLLRVGTTYLPVANPGISANWYVEKLGAELMFLDEDKAILNLASQSIFHVKAPQRQSANFTDIYGNERFSLTFEVDGLDSLIAIHKGYMKKQISVGEIEYRGHAGRNFVFSDPDGNKFDVWSELSPSFRKENHDDLRNYLPNQGLGF